MPPFRVHNPKTNADAVAMWNELGGAQGDGPNVDWSAMYVAGGTDLLPNLKHKLFSPKHLVNLTGLPKTGIVETDTHLVIDGQTKLSALARNPLVREHAPHLAQAASLVAGPQIRNMGTIGGNVLLDTRCLYYNQSAFWRKALGRCLKAEGDWCHVIGGPKTCVAAQSSDTVPVLLGLDASIVLLSPGGERELGLRDLYRFNGFDHLKLERGELLTEVRVPKPGPGFRGVYKKLRVRDSIDFPQLGLAVSSRWDGTALLALDIVVGAAGPTPKPIKKLDRFLGGELTDERIDAIAELVRKGTRPNEAVQGDVAWRRMMSGVFTRRALQELRG
ncbi:MAG: hypothetical protein GY913_11285 [Proteobacteria bacterium]|nr:hypothetical protein [Pseudomonadota bacterium]